jgi:hypothetical protein
VERHDDDDDDDDDDDGDGLTIRDDSHQRVITTIMERQAFRKRLLIENMRQ